MALIILSDTEEMEGGELQVVLKPKEEALVVMERQGGVMRKEEVSGRRGEGVGVRGGGDVGGWGAGRGF